MSLHLIQCDITTLQVDAIVNAANSRLAPGSGVCGAIFQAAGYQKLEAACRAIGGCPTGQAVLTDGFDLPARYVIHTVGPIWQGGGRGEKELLQSCYVNALTLATRQGCKSVAFPLISSGIYGYPREQALRVAISTIQTFLQRQELEVTLALFDSELLALGQKMVGTP